MFSYGFEWFIVGSLEKKQNQEEIQSLIQARANKLYVKKKPLVVSIYCNFCFTGESLPCPSSNSCWYEHSMVVFLICIKTGGFTGITS